MDDKQTPAQASPPAPRHRWLRGFGVGTLAGVLSCAGIAAAHCHHGRWSHARLDPETAIARVETMTNFALWRVDATPQEKARINQITRDAMRDLLPMRDAHRAAHSQALSLLGAATIDRAALEQLRAQQIQHADAATKRAVKALADAAEALAPERRARLAERIKSHLGA